MKKKQKASKKPSLDLFLKKCKKSEMPRRGISLAPINYKAIQEAAGRRDKLQRKQDEIQYPLFKSRLEAMGVTKDQWEKIGEQEDALYKVYQEEILAQDLPLTPGDLPGIGLCREVTIWECQQKVCVDHPVPFDVDEFWLEGDGNVSSKSGPSFNGNHADYYARVNGSSYRSWLMYHRRTKESTGAICLRASTVLVERAKVRQVGINFDGPLETSTGGMANGLYLDGQIFASVVDSYGDGRQTSEFQVSIETPGGTLTRHVPSSESSRIYNNPPAAYQNYASPYLLGGDYKVLPPSRALDLNQTYPAGTFFLIEARISHWIKARGKQSFASVWHSFDAQPFINLESCSWQWPS